MNNPITPTHYTQFKIQPIDAIEDWKLGFNLGNVVKYIARADYKENALVDLEKAAWYLNREIERRKGTWEDPANKINQGEFEAERKKERLPKHLYSDPQNLLDTLLPCPLCGKPPRLATDGVYSFLGCRNPQCAAPFEAQYKFTHLCEKAWNNYARAKCSNPLGEQIPVAKNWADYHPLRNLPPKGPDQSAPDEINTSGATSSLTLEDWNEWKKTKEAFTNKPTKP